MCELSRQLQTLACLLALAFGLLLSPPAVAEEQPQQLLGLREAGLHKPVYRVIKQEAPARIVETVKKDHPLDPALDIANGCLAQIHAKVDDYTCILIKRERIGNRLGDQQFMFAKIRTEKRNNDRVTVPFSVYLKFLKPAAIKGREIIYVAGKNNGNLIAHEGGWKGKITPSIPLNPHGTLAMMNQRYPITEIGIENLCARLIEKGTRDKKLGDCIVKIQPAKINKRRCTRIQVTHPTQLPQLDYHMARIFVDDVYNLPVRYEAYDWPRSGDGVSQDDLIEEYTYVNLKTNVGLSDRDFDPANSNYNMK